VAEVNIVQTPKLQMMGASRVYSVGVETEEEVIKLLATELVASDGEVTALFSRATNSWKVDRLQRSVDIHGLPPRTPELKIRAAMQKLGEIESLQRQVCSRGIKINVTVVFKSLDAIKALEESNKTAIFVGNEHVRIGRIGTQRIQ